MMKEHDNYQDNATLEAAYLHFVSESDEDRQSMAFISFLNILSSRTAEGAYVPMPFVDVENVLLKEIDLEKVKAGATVCVTQDVRLRMDTMVDREGKQWIPLFLNDKECSMGQTANIIIPVAIYDVLRIGLEREDVQGVVVNPFGKAVTFLKDLLSRILFTPTPSDI